MLALRKAVKATCKSYRLVAANPDFLGVFQGPTAVAAPPEDDVEILKDLLRAYATESVSRMRHAWTVGVARGIQHRALVEAGAATAAAEDDEEGTGERRAVRTRFTY